MITENILDKIQNFEEMTKSYLEQQNPAYKENILKQLKEEMF